MSFNLLLQLLLNWNIIVESPQKPEELGEVVSIVKVCIQVLVLIKNFDEDTHDI